MTTTRSLALLWLAAFLALVACAVRVWQAHIDTRQLEHQLGTAQTRLARSNAQLVTAEAVASRLEVRVSQPATPIPLTSEEMTIDRLRIRLAASLARHAREKLPPPILDPFTAAAETSARMPLAEADQAARYRQLYRVRMEQDFNDIIQALPISDEKRAALLDLLVDRKLARLDLLAVSGANRWSPTHLPTAELRAQVNAATVAQSEKFDSELRSLLGPAYPQFQAYAQSNFARMEMSRLVDRLSYTDHPLQPAQFASLVTLVPPQRSEAFFSNIDDRFESHAASVLDPFQQQTLHALRVEQGALAPLPKAD